MSCCCDGVMKLAGGKAASANGSQPMLRRMSTRHLQDNDHGDHPSKKYTFIGEPLGAGTFGVVHRAKSIASGSPCVVKCVALDKVEDQLDMLQNEIELHAHLDHPYVTRIYEYFTDNNEIFIVMEQCNGGELADAIPEDGFAHESEVQAVLKQTVMAVQYLHRQQIVHRDIKPENYLLKDRGVPPASNTVKLIDFGMACRFEPGQRNLTAMCGSPDYMAPEIMAGEPYDESCDMFSCGIMLYELISGRTPFDGCETAEDVQAQKTSGGIRTSAPELARAAPLAKLLVVQMCAAVPSKRFSAARVLQSNWMQKDSGAQETTEDGFVRLISGGTADRLQRSTEQSAFEKAAFHLVAYRVDDEHVRSLRDKFMKIDADGDGTLTLDEFLRAFEGTGVSEEEVRAMYSAMDSDGSGAVDYSEFLAASFDTKKHVDEVTCREVFSSFDKDGSGSISFEEMKIVLSDATLTGGTQMDDDEITSILEAVDSNGDGEIDFEEFMQMVRGEMTCPAAEKGSGGDDSKVDVETDGSALVLSQSVLGA